MSKSTFTAQALYFGKVPSRGDFVRNAASPLSSHLDQWLSQTLVQMANDVDWKQVYDSAPCVDFAILGSHSRTGLAGHLAPTHDSAGRRFPFVVVNTFELSASKAPIDFLAMSAQALWPVWRRLESVASQAVEASEFSNPVQALLTEYTPPRAEPVPGLYGEFAQTHTLADVDDLLENHGQNVSTRQMILALGLLLEPMHSQGMGKPSRALMLSLPQASPQESDQTSLVATLWLDLIAGFFKDTPVDLGIFITSSEQHSAMVVGWLGASPDTLQSVLTPSVGQKSNVNVSLADWVEDCLDEVSGVRQLSNTLRDSGLLVATAIERFKETFFGA
jgi:type VI secretion system protein ImpM